METWETTIHQFGIACFLALDPLNLHGDGDAQEFFPTRESALERAEKIIQAGRFKRVVLYDALSGQWRWTDDWLAD